MIGLKAHFVIGGRVFGPLQNGAQGPANYANPRQLLHMALCTPPLPLASGVANAAGVLWTAHGTLVGLPANLSLVRQHSKLANTRGGVSLISYDRH